MSYEQKLHDKADHLAKEIERLNQQSATANQEQLLALGHEYNETLKRLKDIEFIMQQTAEDNELFEAMRMRSHQNAIIMATKKAEAEQNQKGSQFIDIDACLPVSAYEIDGVTVYKIDSSGLPPEKVDAALNFLAENAAQADAMVFNSKAELESALPAIREKGYKVAEVKERFIISYDFRVLSNSMQKHAKGTGHEEQAQLVAAVLRQAALANETGLAPGNAMGPNASARASISPALQIG